MLKARVPLLGVVFLLCVIGGLAMASRNASGTYSLPAGNPVVTGTTITSTWANNTLNDIKTEITNSLDRQGRGAMLAPLQIVSGTAAAPGLTGSAEPSSGLYRNAAGDWRFSVLTTPVMKWTTALVSSLVPLTVTGRTTTTDLTVTGTSDALAVVSTTLNLRGLSATGNGNAAGVNAFGGTTSGRGVSATGGAPNGVGVYGEGAGTGVGVMAQGGSSAAAGVSATGGAAGVGGVGVLAQGAVQSAGVDATGGPTAGAGVIGRGGTNNGLGVYGLGTGTASGVVGVGGTTGVGVYAEAGTAATGPARQNAFHAANGDISMVGTANPDTTTALTNVITPKSFAKAYATITLGAAGAATVNDGLNITSVATTGAACGGTTQIEVTFASAFTGAGTFTVIPGKASTQCDPRVISQTATTVTIGLQSIRFDGTVPAMGIVNCQQVTCGAGAAATYDWNGQKFTLVAYGAQ